MTLDGPAVVRAGHALSRQLTVHNLAGRQLQLAANGGVTAAVADPQTGETVGGFCGLDRGGGYRRPRASPAPRTRNGGEVAANSTDRARMTISPEMMNPAPPARAPGRPRSRQAQKTASWVEAGPGIRSQTAMASPNSPGDRHR